MELTRRQFIITSSAVTTVLAVPSIYLSSEIFSKEEFLQFKDFTYEQIQHLDKYILSAVIPSLMSMLLLAYSFDMFSLFSSLMIILFSLILIF